MREVFIPQLNLKLVPIAHAKAAELEIMNQILCADRNVLSAVLCDIQSKDVKSQVGRHGMTADQVLRALVIKQLRGLSYEDLAFSLLDSETAKAFVRTNAAVGFGKSALQDNISRISEATMRLINGAILEFAIKAGIEDGTQVRTDCTVVATNIHLPTDSSLLFDVVRVLCRVMEKMRKAGFPVKFRNRTKQAKRTALAILNAKNEELRTAHYRKIIRFTKAVLGEAREACELAEIATDDSFHTLIEHGDRVIEQTVRRVIDGKPMASSEKLISIFEAHSDIIVKDRRETYFGHKVCLTTGTSNLVIDLKILKGNPADTTIASEMIGRVNSVYGGPPIIAAFDGGFASKENLKKIKDMGVANVAFAKKRGILVPDMMKDASLYPSIRNFRAGVEGNISYLKRCFGMRRCCWRGATKFNTYCWGSVITMNLVILARHMMAV